jgi:hypothetical protein
VLLLLLPLDDGGLVLGFPLFGELLGLVLLGLLELGLVELGLLELGLLLDGLLLGEADELSGDVLELPLLLGEAEV